MAPPTLRLANRGLVPHRVLIEGFAVDVLLNPGQETVVELVMPDRGGFEFYSDAYGGQGVRGALVVVP